jgi:hypothetical protein
VSEGEAAAALDLAERLLGNAEASTAGLWPRAAALLARGALEACVERQWTGRAVDLRGCTMATQLICLRSYLDDPRLAARAGHAWSALDRACHHHAYELAPTAGELRSWFAVVKELARAVAPPSA